MQKRRIFIVYRRGNHAFLPEMHGNANDFHAYESMNGVIDMFRKWGDFTDLQLVAGFRQLYRISSR